MKQINAFYSEDVSRTFELYRQGSDIIDRLSRSDREIVSPDDMSDTLHWFIAVTNELDRKISMLENARKKLEGEMKSVLDTHQDLMKQLPLSVLTLPSGIVKSLVQKMHLETLSQLCEYSRSQIVEQSDLDFFEVDHVIRLLSTLYLSLAPDPGEDVYDGELEFDLDGNPVFDDSEEISKKLDAIFGSTTE